MKRVLLTLALAAGMASAQAQKFEGLALTPQMGWNSWNKFACDIDEELVRETADALVETGLWPPQDTSTSTSTTAGTPRSAMPTDSYSATPTASPRA